MTAPVVFIRQCRHRCSDRVKVDIAYQFQQIWVGIDEQRLVTPLENVAGAGLDKIYPRGLALGDVLHDRGERNVAGLHDYVDMVCHQTEGVDAAVELFYSPLQKEIESQPVAVIEENRESGVAAQNDMIDCTGVVYTRFACHA